MTGKRRNYAAARPLTPINATLKSRPVPDTRVFAPYAIGPGADPNIGKTVKSMGQLDALAHPTQHDGVLNSTRNLLALVENYSQLAYEIGEPPEYYRSQDPTWGFYVFVTAYSEEHRNAVPVVLDKIIESTRHNLNARNTGQAYAEEAFRRFKLEVIEDESALSEASYDRVRAEFSAMLRGKPIFDPMMLGGPASNMAFLMLDAESIEKIRDYQIPQTILDHTPLRDTVHLKVVDIHYERPGPNIAPSTYTGWGLCRIRLLARLYEILTTDANSGAMFDLHPMEENL